MIKHITFSSVLLVTVLASCKGFRPGKVERFCSIEMNHADLEEADRMEATLGFAAYDRDSTWNLHDQVSDSIRAKLADDTELEIYLSYLDEDKISFLIFGPDDEKIIQIVSCTIMTGDYEGEMPEQRYMLYYEESQADSRLLAALKRKE